MNRKTVEKFFVNQTTPEETRQVLEWFETKEGKQYLQERLDVDFDLMSRSEIRSMTPDLDSDKLYRSIQKKIRQQQKITRKPDWLGYAFKAAASVLVMLTASFFYVNSDPIDEVTERDPVYFQTEEDQHREITLTDGSVVRLNSNSEMVISEDFMHGKREITLSGEAYFEVAHDPEQPFIIHTNQSAVEVLGTAFNVRSVPSQDNVQVAVVDGKVSFANIPRDGDSDEVVLTKGQYGYLDINKRSILVDDVAVENYLAWKSGRLIFENLSLQQVCAQLRRLYEVQCGYADDGLKDLHLTANFSNESLDKTLSVIALSLQIEFDNQGGHVYWKHEK